tara:strand:+ start:4721 stop:6145 length:1425 start_codon:yes stop_codon:yes gene_type:complete
MANALGVKVGNQDNQTFTDWDFGDEASKTADSLIGMMNKKQDMATRAKERAEDKIFATSERIAGQKFTESQTELSGDIESRQIKERYEETRKGQLLQGKIDINKIKTSGDLEALRQKERLEFTGGENAKDREQKGELFDKEWVNREKQWRAKLESTENLFERGNIFQKEIEQFRQDGDMEALKTRLNATSSENALDREAQQILQSDRLDNSAKISELDRLSRERINNKNIISEALNREKDRLSREGMQEKDIEASLTRMEKGLEFDLKRYKEQGILVAEQARIMKQQEADKTYSFDPAFTNKLYEETGLMGFDENEILADYRGNADDPEKPNIFSGLATNVQQVLQTSPNNPQRKEVLNALIKAQERFSDPRFYDSAADRAMGHANEAYSNLKGVQNLMQMMGPKGIGAIKQIDPNTIMDSSDNILGPTLPAIKAVGSATYDTTQDVINSIIQNMSNLAPSTPATSTPSNMPIN